MTPAIDNSPAARAARLRAIGLHDLADALCPAPVVKPKREKRLTDAELYRAALPRFCLGETEAEIAKALRVPQTRVRGVLFTNVKTQGWLNGRR